MMTLTLVFCRDGEVRVSISDPYVEFNDTTPFQMVQALVETEKWIIEEFYKGDKKRLFEYLKSLYDKDIGEITVH